MKKIFYYTVWDFTNAKSDGICKKIISQIKVIEQHGYQVDYSFMWRGVTYIRRGGEVKKIANYNSLWNKLFANRRLAMHIRKNEYDGVYCRYAYSDWFFIRFLKMCQKCLKKDKVIVEIPTWPYDGEVNNDMLSLIFLAIDRFHRRKLKDYVNKIVTYSNAREIFGIDTIRTINGVDFSEISLREPMEQDYTVHIIAVATIAYWHGYDRFLEGIGEYYSSGGGQTRYLLSLSRGSRAYGNSRGA